MAQLSKFKNGDTLLLSGIYKVNGSPADLTDYTIRSQIKKSGKFITSFTVTIADQAVLANVGLFTMEVSSSNTLNWTPGLYVCDIEFVKDGIVRSTETFEIPVIEGITDPEVTP